jgi:hypothetical protein
MLGVNRCRLVIGVGLCLVFPILNGCQEPDGQSASAPVVSAPASSALPPVTPPVGLVAYQSPQTVSPLANCNLEAVGDQTFGSGALTLQSGRANVFKGWLDAASVTNPVYRIRFDSEGRHLEAPLSLTEQRADVAAAHTGAPLVSGFGMTLPSGALPPGSYHVYLAVESGDTTYVCDSGRHIDVR